MKEQEFENGEELLKRKQQERLIRKGKKKQSFLRSLARFFTCIALVYFIYFCINQQGWYLTENAFLDSNPAIIQIVNNKITRTPKIQNTIKKVEVPKTPIFLANLDNLKSELLSLPPVEDVYIRRYAFPARILVIVQESVPILSISPDKDINPIAAFTKDGKLINGPDYMPLPPEFKTILVLSYGNKGDDYAKWNIDKIKEIEKIHKYVETFSREKVIYIDLRKPDDMFVKIDSVLIRLGKIDSGLYDRIKRIPSILPKLKEVNGKVKYIDLGWEKVNYLKME